MRIKIGIGTNGYIFEDLEKVKACNYCKHFRGYGLHACSGHCFRLNKDIEGGYIGNYHKLAKECNEFEVRTELLEENNPLKKLEKEIKELRKTIKKMNRKQNLKNNSSYES